MGIESLDVPEGSLCKGSGGPLGGSGVGGEDLIGWSAGGSEIDEARAKGSGAGVWIHVSL